MGTYDLCFTRNCEGGGRELQVPVKKRKITLHTTISTLLLQFVSSLYNRDEHYRYKRAGKAERKAKKREDRTQIVNVFIAK